LKKESPAGLLYRQGFSEAEGTRTLNLRIDSPMLKTPKDRTNIDLQKEQKNLGQLFGQYLHHYPELKEIIDSWGTLPDNIKRAIITLTDTSTDKQ